MSNPVNTQYDTDEYEDGILYDHRPYGNFFIIDNMIIDEFGKKIGLNGLAVYSYLCRRADSKTGRSYPKKRTIADDLSTSEKTVERAIQSLVDCGLITRVNKFRPDGSQCANDYYINNLTNVVTPPRHIDAPPPSICRTPPVILTEHEQDSIEQDSMNKYDELKNSDKKGKAIVEASSTELNDDDKTPTASKRKYTKKPKDGAVEEKKEIVHYLNYKHWDDDDKAESNNLYHMGTGKSDAWKLCACHYELAGLQWRDEPNQKKFLAEMEKMTNLRMKFKDYKSLFDFSLTQFPCTIMSGGKKQRVPNRMPSIFETIKSYPLWKASLDHPAPTKVFYDEDYEKDHPKWTPPVDQEKFIKEMEEIRISLGIPKEDENFHAQTFSPTGKSKTMKIPDVYNLPSASALVDIYDDE